MTYKGQKVYPSELENILLSHPGVVDAAVVGASRPNNDEDYNTGEVPYGLVVVTPSSSQATLAVTRQELLEFVATKVKGHKELKWHIKIVEAVPRGPAGKILRSELKKMVLNN
jgi:acyl-coenzyme A synthetase/AMP-(fatty) acid ligase